MPVLTEPPTMKRLNIKISPTGEFSVDAEGYQDGSCKLATAPLLEALAANPNAVQTEDKPEAAIPAMNSNLQTLGY